MSSALLSLDNNTTHE